MHRSMLMSRICWFIWRETKKCEFALLMSETSKKSKMSEKQRKSEFIGIALILPLSGKTGNVGKMSNMSTDWGNIHISKEKEKNWKTNTHKPWRNVLSFDCICGDGNKNSLAKTRIVAAYSQSVVIECVRARLSSWYHKEGKSTNVTHSITTLWLQPFYCTRQ